MGWNYYKGIHNITYHNRESIRIIENHENLGRWRGKYKTNKIFEQENHLDKGGIYNYCQIELNDQELKLNSSLIMSFD